MVIDMNDAQLHTLEQLRAFLNGTMAVGFSVDAHERCGFITRILRRFGYPREPKGSTKGVRIDIIFHQALHVKTQTPFDLPPRASYSSCLPACRALPASPSSSSLRNSVDAALHKVLGHPG